MPQLLTRRHLCSSGNILVPASAKTAALQFCRVVWRQFLLRVPREAANQQNHYRIGSRSSEMIPSLPQYTDLKHFDVLLRQASSSLAASDIKACILWQSWIGMGQCHTLTINLRQNPCRQTEILPLFGDCEVGRRRKTVLENALLRHLMEGMEP